MVSVMLYPCMLCVALLMYLFISNHTQTYCELFGETLMGRWSDDSAC